MDLDRTGQVALFTTRFGVPHYELPQRIYRGRRPGRGTTTTTRYFVHKLPIGVQPDTATVTFVVLVTDVRGQPLREFLADHMQLPGRLSDWRIIAILPRHVAGRPACDAVFASARTAPRVVWPPAAQDDLRFVFRISRIGRTCGTSRRTTSAGIATSSSATTR